MDNESLRSEGSFVTLSGNNNYETDQDKTVEFQDSAKDTSFIKRLRENFGPPGKKRDTRITLLQTRNQKAKKPKMASLTFVS